MLRDAELVQKDNLRLAEDLQAVQCNIPHTTQQLLHCLPPCSDI